MKALITGASGGIGSATAELLAENGYEVFLGSNSHYKQAEEFAEKLTAAGYRAKALKFDIKDSKEVEVAAAATGPVDVLVNNAGTACWKLFNDITDDEYNEVFDVNVRGTFNCIRAYLPQMIHNKNGSIINISSMWGQTGASCEVIYSAAKSAVIGLTKALAKETAPSNIRVNCICPGAIDTKMNDNLSDDDKRALIEEIPLGRIGKPSEIAETILFLSGESSSYITGAVIPVNGGILI